ncbi:hypothetical protein [Paraburkholderia sp. CI3]|uniref:hypothetical protein n=1 Tax=Paraburkholderia sp. CI3 TaxID=2991060 RepID=UPI003D1E7E83
MLSADQLKQIDEAIARRAKNTAEGDAVVAHETATDREDTRTHLIELAHLKNVRQHVYEQWGEAVRQLSNHLETGHLDFAGSAAQRTAFFEKHFGLTPDMAPEMCARLQEIAGHYRDALTPAKQNCSGHIVLADGTRCRSLDNGSYCIERTKGAEQYRLLLNARDDEGAADGYQLHLSRREGGETEVSVPLGDDPWETLKTTGFHEEALRTLFQESDRLTSTPFKEISARKSAEDMLSDKVLDTMNQTVRDEVEEAFADTIAFHGTGYSFNKGLANPNYVSDWRNTVMREVLTLAMDDMRFAVQGSCGFAQDLLWVADGTIVQYESLSGLDYASSPHGGEIYDVLDKVTLQAVNPFTMTAGMFEQPTGLAEMKGKPVYDTRLSEAEADTRIYELQPRQQLTSWRPRDYQPLTVPIRGRLWRPGGEGSTADAASLMLRDDDDAPIIASKDLQVTRMLGVNGTEISLENGAALTEVSEITLQRRLPPGESLIDDEGHVVIPGNDKEGILLETITLRRRDPLPSDESKAFEIASINRQMRVPVIRDGRPVLDDNNIALCTYENVVSNDHPSASSLVDRIYTRINCVHSQHGLMTAETGARLGRNVEVAATSYPHDGVSREFPGGEIPAVTRSAQDAVRVNVPEGEIERNVIESLEIRGNPLVHAQQPHNDGLSAKELPDTHLSPIIHVPAGSSRTGVNRQGHQHVIGAGITSEQRRRMLEQLKSLVNPNRQWLKPQANSDANDRSDASNGANT